MLDKKIVITPELSNTSQIIFKKVYLDEFIILVRFALAVLIASIISIYIRTYFIKPYEKQFWYVTLFVIILCLSLSLIIVELITYLKLQNNRDSYLKELTNMSFLSGIN